MFQHELEQSLLLDSRPKIPEITTRPALQRLERLGILQRSRGPPSIGGHSRILGGSPEANRRMPLRECHDHLNPKPGSFSPCDKINYEV